MVEHIYEVDAVSVEAVFGGYSYALYYLRCLILDSILKDTNIKSELYILPGLLLSCYHIAMGGGGVSC